MLEHLLTALNDCVWAFDLDKQSYLFISPNISGITGYPANDFHHNKNLWTEIVYQGDHDRVKAFDSVNSNTWTEHTYRITMRGGKPKWIHQKKLLYADPSTGHNLVLSIIKDVSAPEATIPDIQEEITWTKNNLEALINNTEDFIWSIDQDGCYVYMNTGYKKRILATRGITPQEGDNAYLHSGSTDEINEKWRSYYQRALLGERYEIRHESRELGSEETSYFEVSFNPIYKRSKNEVTGVGVFARDITGRLNTEHALIAQNERLRSIASLSSHELRRPVASMLGLVNIFDLKDINNPQNAQVIEHLIVVSKEIDDVIRLIVNKTFIDALPGKPL